MKCYLQQHDTVKILKLDARSEDYISLFILNVLLMHYKYFSLESILVHSEDYSYFIMKYIEQNDVMNDMQKYTMCSRL